MNINGFALVFLVINGFALLFLPRRWAPLPLLIGTCYMTLGQGINVGPFTFTILRMLVAVGLIRIIVRGERLVGEINGLDWLVIIWSLWALASSYFHEKSSEALIFRLGLVYNTCGIYFLLRVFCRSLKDVVQLCRLTAILLAPVALEMVFEKIAGYNLFSIFGGISLFPEIREGKLRAQGPFAHSILAGTVGAVCLPLMVGLWRFDRKSAFLGILSCVVIAFASASSGPLSGVIAATGALLMWYWRYRMRFVRWVAIIGYIIIDLVMLAPAYYLLGRIDLAGGSAGWHRAELINAAIRYFEEWWFAGTDYTRHWMPTGVSWSPDHTDITNHYLYMGILGGLPLMLLFIAKIAKGFSLVGRIWRKLSDQQTYTQFIFWGFGASLFVHAAICISVAYFDQSFLFLYLTLAVIGSAYSGIATKTTLENQSSQSTDT